MGRKMDALLRRGFRASKFKNLAKLAITRLAILKNQRQVRSSNARFDVVQMLNLGHQDRALLRIEHVIKEENMLGLFVMMEGFINLLTERITLLQDNKECPEELEEAISSLIFAATRCGEFPELKHIRETFASRFGKDFDTSASEVRNSCKVHPQMIQRLTTRKPTMENKMKMLEEIASEHGIILRSPEATGSDVYQVVTGPHEGRDLEAEHKHITPREPPTPTDLHKLAAEEEINILVARLSESIKAKKFGGVADAAQEAFDAAAHAAAAARAAVELSRTDSDSEYSDESDQEDQEPTTTHESTQQEIKNSTDDIDRDHQEPTVHESTQEEIKNSTDDIDRDHQELITHESTPEEIKNSANDIDQDHREPITHEPTREEIKNSTDDIDQDHREPITHEPTREEIKNSTDELGDNDQDHQEPIKEIKNSTDGLVVFGKMDSRNGSGSESDDQEEFYSFRNQEVALYYETETETEAELVSRNDSDMNMEPNLVSEAENRIGNHRTERKYRLESRRTFSDFGQQAGVDRKLMSVKTTPVLRLKNNIIR